MTTVLIGPERQPDARTADGQLGRRVEWLGELSPMDDPFLWTGIAANRFTPDMVMMIRRAALRRAVKFRNGARSLGFQYEDGNTGGRVIRSDPPGMSRRYLWSHANRWTCVLTYADADKVLGCGDGHEFRDLDATDQDDPGLILPPREMQPGNTVILKEIERMTFRTYGTDLERVGF